VLILRFHVGKQSVCLKAWAVPVCLSAAEVLPVVIESKDEVLPAAIELKDVVLPVAIEL
jgi:hypothetical protein